MEVTQHHKQLKINIQELKGFKIKTVASAQSKERSRTVNVRDPIYITKHYLDNQKNIYTHKYKDLNIHNE